jgi:hypothetical protein
MELVMVSKWYKKKRFGGKVGGRERDNGVSRNLEQGFRLFYFKKIFALKYFLYSS